MKKMLYILFFVFSLSAFAQISITQSDVSGQLVVGETILNYVDTTVTTADIGATGQSNWDFSGLQEDFTIESEGMTPSGTPAASEFPNASHVSYSMPTFAGATSETWVYLDLNSSEYLELGLYSETTAGGMNSTTTMTTDPDEIIFNLPLKFEDSWSQQTTRTFTTETSGFTNSYTVDADLTKTVDAWGSLTMPDGTVVDVLRIKVNSETTSNIGGVPTTTENLTFMFMSKSGAFISLTATDPNAPDNGTISVDEATWSYGPGTTDIEETDVLPTDYRLAQNYPNPFNPSTTIEFSIPEASQVSLKIYDVLGKEVTTLVDKKLGAGVYNTNFDASDLPSGIYFYTLKANNFISTKKLMLVK